MRPHFGTPRKWAFVILPLLLTIMLLYGCKPTKYIEVEKIVKDVEYKTLIERDSIYLHDSTYIYVNGDTFRQTIIQDRYIYKLLHDTAYVSHVDSIPYPVFVEKELSRWQNLKLQIGGYALGALITVLLVIVYAIYKHLTNR